MSLSIFVPDMSEIVDSADFTTFTIGSGHLQDPSAERARIKDDGPLDTVLIHYFSFFLSGSPLQGQKYPA